MQVQWTLILLVAGAWMRLTKALIMSRGTGTQQSRQFILHHPGPLGLESRFSSFLFDCDAAQDHEPAKVNSACASKAQRFPQPQCPCWSRQTGGAAQTSVVGRTRRVVGLIIAMQTGRDIDHPCCCRQRT